MREVWGTAAARGASPPGTRVEAAPGCLGSGGPSGYWVASGFRLLLNLRPGLQTPGVSVAGSGFPQSGCAATSPGNADPRVGASESLRPGGSGGGRGRAATVFEVVEWCVLLTHFVIRSSVELLVVEGCAGAEESCTFMDTVFCCCSGEFTW